jgi:hypothetical protein
MFDLPLLDHAMLQGGYTDTTGHTFTGNNGFTVTDTFTCHDGCGSFTVGGSDAGANGNTTGLAFEHSDYTDSAGNVYTGSNGFTVTDNYSCGDTPCGEWSVVDTYGQAAAAPHHTQGLAFAGSDYVDSAGNVYTGSNGFTVTDNYTCGDTPCGEFSVADVYGQAAAAPHHTQGLAHADSQALQFQNTSSFDSNGTEYTGNNGWTAEDNYSCNNIPCGSYGTTGAIAAPLATVPEAPEAEARTTRPTPGQFWMCGHAMVLGAVEATGKVCDSAAKGESSDLLGLWNATFKKVSEDAASSVAPLSGFALRNHVLA